MSADAKRMVDDNARNAVTEASSSGSCGAVNESVIRRRK
jgi:hypothetical protein